MNASRFAWPNLVLAPELLLLNGIMLLLALLGSLPTGATTSSDFHALNPPSQAFEEFHQPLEILPLEAREHDEPGNDKIDDPEYY